MRGKFETGRIVITSQVNQLMEEDISFRKFVQLSVGRFLWGDWGDVSEEDRARNEQAVKNGERIFASYVKHGLKDGEKFEKYRIWIITDAGRILTTIMFPYEY